MSDFSYRVRVFISDENPQNVFDLNSRKKITFSPINAVDNSNCSNKNSIVGYFDTVSPSLEQKFLKWRGSYSINCYNISMLMSTISPISSGFFFFLNLDCPCTSCTTPFWMSRSSFMFLTIKSTKSLYAIWRYRSSACIRWRSYVNSFANSEDFPQHFEGQNILLSQVVEQLIDELFFLRVEDLG